MVAVAAAAVAVPIAPSASAASTDDADVAAALAAADDFLDAYLQPSGRIARTDEGGDTVSEGQAYGMLVAVALDDEQRFRRIWAWTDGHLQRADGLLAWRWADGGIVDHQPAADADLLAAAALALAGDRFGDADLLADARLISDGILAAETITLGEARVLTAGPWAAPQRLVNPSYLVTPAMSVLWDLLGDQRWGPVAAQSRRILDELTVSPPHLPPDWAVVDAAGIGVEPHPGPAGDEPRYGYEAPRVLVQSAVDCRASGQAVAARAWPFLAEELAGDGVAAAYSLDGERLDGAPHPLALVAAAAAAASAGDAARAAGLLDQATALDDAGPSYYGAAWIALGRLWLHTDLLGGCRPGDLTEP